MALSDIDRRLLTRCLAAQPRSWEEFVDRFMGLVLHVVNHTAASRVGQLSQEDREDLVSDVFLAFVADDLAVLRRFRGNSSLATYLTVIARRVVIRKLSQWQQSRTLERARRDAVSAAHDSVNPPHGAATVEQRISDEDELEQLLGRLDGDEAQIVRLYHLEGKSYREISDQIGMPENTIGPTLSRARTKMRQASADSTLN